MSTALPPWLQPQLASLLAQGSQAVLLQGPSGLGQHALALALVRAWLCEQPTASGACGTCASCHAIDVHTHADLCLLMPQSTLAALGYPLAGKAAEASEEGEKKAKLSREIRIDDLRDAIEFCQRSSARGRGKAVLIYPAERMNTPTANALLKTLEEPPGQAGPEGQVRFVLATEAAHLLLPTIRSRCITHTMAWPATADALQWMAVQGVPTVEAQVLLRAAGGRPEDALADVQNGLDAQQWRAFPQALRQGQASAFAGCTPGQAVARLQKLCHDLLAQQFGAPPRFFAASDLPKLGPGNTIAALTAWSKALSRSARISEHPLNAPLMLAALAQQARQALDST
jgi:DNA polymerase III subunit delta'